jgi:alkylation response protein AidB-like acyl-CoA dehydrogenase
VFAYAIAAPAIGAATGALECWREGSRARRTAYDHKIVAEDPFAQMRLAEAASEVDGARQRMLDTFDEMIPLQRTDATSASSGARGFDGTPRTRYSSACMRSI